MPVPTKNHFVRAGLLLAIALSAAAGAQAATQAQPSPEDGARQANETVRETVVSIDETNSRPGANPETIKRRHDATRGMVRGGAAGLGGVVQQLDVAPRGQLRDMCLAECKRLGHETAKCEEGC